MATLGKDSHVTVSEHVRCRRFDDELVMLDLSGGEYFALDAIGARMWEGLVAGRTPAEVASELVDEYDVSEEELTRDCVQLVAQLLERGLLVWKTS